MDFCPRCGKRGTRGSLCAQCEAAEQEVRQGKEIIVTVCTSCKRVLHRSRWHALSLEDAIQQAAKVSLPDLKKITVEQEFQLPGPGTKQDLIVSGTLDGATYELPVRIITTLCQNCGKRHTKYFEGILQLRNPKPEIVAFIRKTVEKQQARGIFIARETTLQNGIDFHLTSQRYLQVLGRLLIRQFGGDLQVNAQLFSHDHMRSRDLYRVNVCYTAPPFGKGDILHTTQGPLEVTDPQRKRGKLLKTGKYAALPRKPVILKTSYSRVVKVTPNVEVLHPETYQAVTVGNKVLRKLEKGEKVKIVLADHTVFVV